MLSLYALWQTNAEIHVSLTVFNECQALNMFVSVERIMLSSGPFGCLFKSILQSLSVL